MIKHQSHRRIFAVIALALAIFNSGPLYAGAKDKANVMAFYELLSNPGSDAAATRFSEAVSDSWESIGNYSGKNKTKEKFLGQMKGFAKLIPDLNWAIEEMLRDGNKIVVRSRATGTPVGPLFGVDGKGKGFDILTIDIHTLKGGKIIRTYHVEDWAGALAQLKAQ